MNIIKLLLKSYRMRFEYLFKIATLLLFKKGIGEEAKNMYLFYLSAHSKMKKISLGDIIPNDTHNDLYVSVIPSLYQTSTISVEDMILATLVKAYNPKHILEIGTYKGQTTRNFFLNTSDETMIYTVDLPDELYLNDSTDAILTRNKARPHLPNDKRVNQILVNMRHCKLEEYIPNKIDFAFIDAGHSYEDVKNDTEKVFNVLNDHANDHAIVCWHDSLWNKNDYGVFRYLNELLNDGYEMYQIHRSFELSSIAIYISPALKHLHNLKI